MDLKDKRDAIKVLHYPLKKGQRIDHRTECHKYASSDPIHYFDHNTCRPRYIWPESLPTGIKEFDVNKGNVVITYIEHADG